MSWAVVLLLMLLGTITVKFCWGTSSGVEVGGNWGVYGPIYSVSPRTSAGFGHGGRRQSSREITMATSREPVRLSWKNQSACSPVSHSSTQRGLAYRPDDLNCERFTGFDLGTLGGIANDYTLPECAAEKGGEGDQRRKLHQMERYQVQLEIQGTGKEARVFLNARVSKNGYPFIYRSDKYSVSHE